MNKYEKLAARIIELVEEAVLKQHPKIKLHTKETIEAGIEHPSVVSCSTYYLLEQNIAQILSKINKNSKKRDEEGDLDE